MSNNKKISLNDAFDVTFFFVFDKDKIGMIKNKMKTKK
jgi:hypothetical protein